VNSEWDTRIEGTSEEIKSLYLIRDVEVKKNISLWSSVPLW